MNNIYYDIDVKRIYFILNNIGNDLIICILSSANNFKFS